jgi:hypothetical protein
LFSTLSAALDAVNDPVISQQARDLKNEIQSFDPFWDQYTVTSDAQALGIIHELIAKTGFHVGLRSWKTFNFWVENLPDDELVALDARAQKLAFACLKLAEETMIPCIIALQRIARQRGKAEVVRELYCTRFSLLLAFWGTVGNSK